MRVEIKKGVWFKEINNYLLTVCYVIYNVISGQGAVPVITSACDGKHMTNSYHYEGLAWDVRTRNIRNPQLAADLIRAQLHSINKAYDVVYGDEKHLDHIHIEFDRRKEVRT